MKKILLLLVVSFFVGKNCEAQNLVPNPSFEEYTLCPNDFTHWAGPDQVQYATDWSSFGNTADYFNSCSHDTDTSGATIVNVPNNIVGYQYAASGNAYCGVITSDAVGTNDYLEFIGAELISPLVLGTKYFVSVKINLANKCRFATSGFGIAFSTVQYTSALVFPYYTVPGLVISNNVIIDTLNWTTISGEFVADSAYKYVVLGRFLPSTVLQTGFNSFMYPYYYIDDVCVSPDSLACDLNPEGIYNFKETKASINLYPNPVSEQLTVNCKQTVSRIETTNSLGVKVYAESGNLNSKIINLKSLPSGIYFIKVYFGDGSMEVRRFVKE